MLWTLTRFVTVFTLIVNRGGYGFLAELQGNIVMLATVSWSCLLIMVTDGVRSDQIRLLRVRLEINSGCDFFAMP